MDSNALKTFLIVADKGSFSKAASILQLTQPAISRRIAQLESEVGSQLLDRAGRSVSLTPAGKELLPGAKQILAEMEEARKRIQHLSETVSGTLSLATSHHIGLWRLPSLLRPFRQKYPQVLLDLHFMDSEPAHELILREEMELGLVTLAPRSQPRLNSLPVWTDPLVYVISPDDPLASGTLVSGTLVSGKKEVSLSMLSNRPAVLPDTSTFTGRIVRQIFSQSGLPLVVNTSTNYLETLKMLTSIGLGWSVIPATMVDSSVTELAVKSNLTARTLGFIHLKNKTLSRASQAFIDTAMSSETAN